MALLTAPAFIGHVLSELEPLETPTGPDRRRGASEHAANVVRMVRRDAGGVRRLFEADRLSPKDAASQVADLALELTSLLFAAGASHATWRHWSGLTALGYFLVNRIAEAAQYAALGGEWSLLTALPASHAPRRLVDHVVWSVLLRQPFRARPARDEVDSAWISLATSVRAQNHPETLSALKAIAQHWIDEDDDWREFHTRSAPDFEPTLCAVAALARRDGLRPTDLTPDQQAFLEPGLAELEPAPLWPETFSGASTNGSVRGQLCPSP